VAFTQQNPLSRYVPGFLFENGILSEGIRRYVAEAGEDDTTVRGSLFVAVASNGLFPEDAKGVLNRVFKSNSALGGIEHRAIEGYPPVLYTVMWVAACIETLRWIDEHCPEHWARDVFVYGSGKDLPEDTCGG
jgi:hypothetical protein